jgi:hypothetical protein
MGSIVSLRSSNSGRRMSARGPISDFTDRQIGGLIAFKNSPGIDSDKAMSVRNVGSVAHQTTGRSELAPLVDCGHRVLSRQRSELLGMAAGHPAAPPPRSGGGHPGVDRARAQSRVGAITSRRS